ATARLAEDGASWVLHRRNRVDVFDANATALEVVECGGECVDADALLIERDAHRVHPQSLEARERALITFLLDENRISRREQQTVDEIEPLQRSRGDQDFIGSAGDAGGTLELAGQEFPQRTVAERPGGGAGGRELRASALEQGGIGRNETIDRHLIGIVVAADEVVFGKSRPLGCGRRQRWRQERREIEGCGGHAVSFLPKSEA